MSCLSLYDPAGRSLDTVIVCFRLVADLAAQLIALGPWKVVYDQLQVLNPPWFEQHAIRCPEQPVGSGERCHTTGKPCVCSHVYSNRPANVLTLQSSFLSVATYVAND